MAFFAAVPVMIAYALAGGAATVPSAAFADALATEPSVAFANFAALVNSAVAGQTL